METQERLQTYAQIVAPAWPLTTRGLSEYGPKGRWYWLTDVQRKLLAVSAHLAYSVIPLESGQAARTGAKVDHEACPGELLARLKLAS